MKIKDTHKMILKDEVVEQIIVVENAIDDALEWLEDMRCSTPKEMEELQIILGAILLFNEMQRKMARFFRNELMEKKET